MTLAIIPAPPLSNEQARFYLGEFDRLTGIAREAAPHDLQRGRDAIDIQLAILRLLRGKGVSLRQLRELAS